MMAVNPSKFTGDLLPVENVTWYDAVLFCNALSKHEGRDTVYSYTGTPIVGSNGETAELTGISADMAKNGYRLPTEAEWEFAAQGKRNTKYATDDGTISTSKGNYNATEANPPTGSTVSVGQYPANLYGLFDMAGNLWEWCHDYYGGYSVDAQIDPLGGTIGTHRVLRGGSWYNHASYTRTAGRNKGKPYIRDYDVGFRIVSRDY